jgi:sulfur-carrier protein
MAEVHFTAWLRTIVGEHPRDAQGATVGAALDALFEAEPHARGYVLDEQGRLRKHVCIFADGKRLPHASALTQAIGPNSKLYVMQALSGG